MDRKQFTISEANRAIPTLSRLLQGLQERFRWLNEHRQAVPYLIEQYQIVNEGPVRADYFAALMGVRSALRRIESLGAQVKDVRAGLVDFPSRLYGRDVLLCWRLGEDQVGFWHDLESGFAGRQPLPSMQAESGGEGEGH